MSILTAAQQLTTQGISIVPTLPGGEKKPATNWKPYQNTPPTIEQVQTWYTQHPDWGIAAISGTVSGNLLMIELEGRAVQHFAELKDLAHNSGMGDLWDKCTTGWFESSPSGGLHWFIRSTKTVPGNQKLARRPATNQELETWKQTETTKALNTQFEDEKLLAARLQKISNTKPTDIPQVLAETRGEAGYTIVSPTDGSHHTTGRPWALLAGGPTTIPVLTPEEVGDFLTLFRTLDQTPSPSVPTIGPVSPFPTATIPQDGRLKPGDDFENKTTWCQILEPHGWTINHQAGGTIYWCRPGKNRGISATTGNANDRDRLYVFTTSTELPTEQPLTKFGAYTLLEHAGNYQNAAKQLAAEGFGDPLPPIEIDLPKSSTNDRQEEVTTDGNLATVHTLPQRHTVTHSGKLNETANSTYLVDAYGDEMRYVIDRDRWLHWNGHQWKPTGRGAAPIKQLAVTALEALPDDLEKWRNRSLNSSSISNTLTLAATDPRVAIEQSQLDGKPGELNTPGGIVNLHTGKLAPPEPSHLHTRATLVAPNPECPTPKWDAFLTETFQGHDGLIPYVQQLAGYSATGYVSTQILPFLFGAGANGKSVLAEVLMRLLDDYAEPAPANFLMMTQTQHPTEIARLQGARMVVASEVPEGAKFDEVKVKQLTGGDTLTARYMHGDFFTFQPSHKLWLLGNHQPKVSAGGYSFWRRLRQIPFTNIVPEDKRVGNLSDQLVETEGPGILAWIVEGAVSYLQNGLTEPDEVLLATKAYEESEDHLQRFINDRINVGGGHYVRATRKAVRHAYVDWCRFEGLTPMSANAFTREVGTRFDIQTAKSHGIWQYNNCTLLADENEPEIEEENNNWRDLGGGIFR